MDRRLRALHGMLMGTCFAAVVVLAQSLPGCFLSMGDWGSSNRHVSSMSTFMQGIINDPGSVGCANISFLLALGDNFYPTGVQSVDDPQWQTTFVDQFRSYSAFKDLPIYAVVGDHDYNQLNPQEMPNRSRAEVQIEYSTAKDPLWILPDTNYTFTADFGHGRRILFVVMDTEALYTCLRLNASWCFKRDQEVWLEDVLAAADNDTSISAVAIVGHHAVVCPLGGHYDPFIDDVLVPIGRRHRVSLFLTAHSHFLAWSSETDLSGGGFDAGEMWYIINGAARGAGAYQCWWDGLRFRVARPANKLCFPFSFNDAGAFMVHKVHQAHFEHCVVASMNGTVVRCQTAAFRTSGSNSTTEAIADGE